MTAEMSARFSRSDNRVIEGTVIPPSRPPRDLSGKEPMRARLLETLRAIATRAGAGPPDPLMPPDGQACQACAVDRNRDKAGHFAVAEVELEVAGQAWQLALCRKHRQQAAAALRRAGVLFFEREIGVRQPHLADATVRCLSCSALMDAAHPDVCAGAGGRHGVRSCSAGSPSPDLGECRLRFGLRGCLPLRPARRTRLSS